MCLITNHDISAIEIDSNFNLNVKGVQIQKKIVGLNQETKRQWIEIQIKANLSQRINKIWLSLLFIYFNATLFANWVFDSPLIVWCAIPTIYYEMLYDFIIHVQSIERI